MFQDFDATTHPDQGPPRLEALRREMAREEVSAFLVPRADVHQGEYVAHCDERLAWLTGFTGSAGFCAVLPGKAGVFIDGRYRVQVRAQVDTSVFTPVPWPETRLGPWLAENLPSGARAGYDPWLHTSDEIAQLRRALEPAGITLAPCHNLVDRIWEDRPPPPAAPVTVYPLEFAGTPHEEKRAAIAATLREAGESAAVLTLPDSICWLLNIRGSDLTRTPLVQAFAILHDDGRCDLFLRGDPGHEVTAHLGSAVHLHGRSDFEAALGRLSGKVRLDPKSAPAAAAALLEAAGATISPAEDPCILPKACKTPAEITATREAHLRDAAAMTEFLAWLDAQPPGSLTETEVVSALEGFRRATNALRDISFDTIAGSGPNGAIVHYRVTRQTDRRVEDGDLLLVDSGGQYLDGTTDITRTIAIGAPSAFQISCFTRVLKGMIALSRLRFPAGLAGRDIDALARAPLWEAGLDYDHGTGHGVGVYLGVHEGPQRISRLAEVELRPGMILSNEPGYYREGQFGIRIENLIVTAEAPDLPMGDARRMLHFETLTHVPIDRRLIDPGLLGPADVDWLNAYHAHCAAVVGPRVGKSAAMWLKAATAPL